MNQQTTLLPDPQAPNKRDPRDYYPTPKEAAVPLVQEFLKPHDYVWEPACGRGNLVEVMRDHGCKVVGSDLHDYSDQEPATGLHFGLDGLDFDPFELSNNNAVVTNPPYSLAREFIEAFVPGPWVTAFLLRNSIFGSIERHAMWQRYPPAAIRFLVPRPSFTGGGTDNSEYAWVVWSRDRPMRCARPIGWYHWR